MNGCVEVTASPDHPNKVKTWTSIDVDFLYIITALRENTLSTGVLLDTCADLYAHFHYVLGEALTTHQVLHI